MRHIIFLFTISMFLISCNQNDNKQKELELKEKELALKEKEMELKERELKVKKSDSNKTKAIDNTNNAEFPIPTGYRLPTKDDLKKGTGWYACVTLWNLPEPYHAVGDFNGDGLTDHAYILLKGGTNRWGIFCFFKTLNGYDVIQLPVGTEIKEKYEQNIAATEYAIKPWKKGEIVCLYDNSDNIVNKKRLAYDAIGFELLESHASAFLFDKSKNSFKNYFDCDE